MCALGIVRVENGEIAEKRYWLIRPPRLYFHPANIAVHGIKPADVAQKPEFGDLWENIEPYLEGQAVVAHNAPFDFRVLKAVLQTYEIVQPSLDYFCTVQISRRVWKQLPNHRLNTLGSFFGINFHHHNAIDDALVCAHIANNACQKTQTKSLHDLAQKIKLKPKIMRLGAFQ